MATQPKPRLTPEEYLIRERAAETKSEYYNGEVFAMAGASERHNLIVSNLVFSLVGSLRQRDCRVYSNDMRLLVSDTGLYTYPDVLVVCGSPNLVNKDGDVLTNPLLIIEVLSESTKDYDRGGKLHQYMRIPSLQEYLTVSQSEMLIDQHLRQADGSWLVREIGPQASQIRLQRVGIELQIPEIYEKVKFDS